MKKFSLTAILIIVFAGSVFAQNLPRTVTNRATLASWVRAGTFTFTNKTLTSPTITSPTITGTGTMVLATLEVNGAITLANNETIANSTNGDVFINYSDDSTTLGELIFYNTLDDSIFTDEDLFNIEFRSLDEDSTAVNDWVTLEAKITDFTGDSKDSQFAIKTYLGNSATTSLTISGEILTLANAATIDNSTTSLLTITEATVDVVGILTANSVASDGAVSGTSLTFDSGLTMTKMDTVCEVGGSTPRWAILTIDGVAFAVIAAADTAKIVD